MAFVKDMLRMWAHSWKRFISIAMITLLGVAVLTGIYAGCRDAFRSTDRFFDAQGLHDVQVLSTAGLSNGDIAALRKVNGVAKVQAERSQEVTFDLDGRKSATMQEIGTNGIDQPYLQEGRMPKKAGEIAVTRKFIRDSGKHIGSRLTVTPESASSDTSDTSDTNGADGTNETNGTDEAPSFPTKLTIVGVVLDPQNLSNPDGYSAMTSFRSTATTDYTFFAPSDGVTGTLYTSATLLVKGAAAESTFDESYENTVKQVTDRIDGTVKTDRQKARRQELLDAGNKKIVDARAEADKKFADAQSQIDANRQQFNQQVDQIVDMQASAAAANAGAAAAAGAPNAAAAAGTNAPNPQLDETTRETMRETIIAASPELTQAKQQLDQAQSQLNEQKASTEQTLKTKENELKTSIPQVRWYVQDRQSLGGFSALKSDLDSIQSLGNAFPIVFLLVAVMMSLTAMARMVEEDRSLIGTYVGLGYGRLAVASRYLLFALLACLIGGGLGLIAGFLGIPAFLLVVLQGMYVMPGLRLEYDWLYGSLGIALFVVGVLAATIYACVQEMRQTPAALMRPKAPRAGSRILLERIRPVWNRIGFLGKVTARNIFRFKSRLIMTVGGVAGCTALIVCGLAINDTVADLGIKQYRDIYQYDLMVVSDDSDASAMRTKVASDGRVTSSLDVRIESGDLTVAGSGDGDSGKAGSSGSESIQLVAVPEKHLSDLGEMVTLQPVSSGMLGTSGVGKTGSLKLDDDGVIVAQSAASALGVKAGSKVRLTNGDGVQATAKVSAVNRNLIGSDVYVSETYYAKLSTRKTRRTPRIPRVPRIPSSDVERHARQAFRLRHFANRLCGIARRGQFGDEGRKLRAHGRQLQIRPHGRGGGADRGACRRSGTGGAVHARQHERVGTRARDGHAQGAWLLRPRSAPLREPRDDDPHRHGCDTGPAARPARRRHADDGAQHALVVFRGGGQAAELRDRGRGDHGLRAARAAVRQPRPRPHRPHQLPQVRGVAPLRSPLSSSGSGSCGGVGW